MYVIDNSNIYTSIEYFAINTTIECLNQFKNDLVLPTEITLYTAKATPSRIYDYGGASQCMHIIDINEKVMLNNVTNEIEICIEIEEIYDSSFINEACGYRLKDFLKNINIPYNKYTIFLWLILHELGHAYISTLFIKADMKREYELLFILAKATVDSIVTDDIYNTWNEKFDIPLSQYVDALELVADNFAYKNFIKIWNMTKKYSNFSNGKNEHEQNRVFTFDLTKNNLLFKMSDK